MLHNKSHIILSQFVCLTIITMFCLSTAINAQGLERVIVEPYYVSDSADANYAGFNNLPAGSVTYRVFVDMKPGYVLQSVFGDARHEMKIGTTTNFYNHPVFGNFLSNLILEPYLPNTVVMLDSWISVGAGAQLNFGILKSDDDTAGTIRNSYKPHKLLQHHDPKAGIPLTERDGLRKGVPERVTAIQIDSLLEMMDKRQAPPTGQEFKTTNGAWACIEGAKGPDPETNRVLIGQFTTSGRFYFELNIQIRKTGEPAEQFVARNPAGQNQFAHPDLIYTSNTLSRP
jgi:hypothetical protein